MILLSSQSFKFFLPHSLSSFCTPLFFLKHRENFRQCHSNQNCCFTKSTSWNRKRRFEKKKVQNTVFHRNQVKLSLFPLFNREILISFLHTQDFNISNFIRKIMAENEREQKISNNFVPNFKYGEEVSQWQIRSVT